MTLDEEMKLWEERSNDEFGQILKKIKKATKDYLYSWTEMGIEYNALSEYITGYSLYDNRKYTAKAIYNILDMYDILGNQNKIKKLADEMMKLAINE